jgi:Domain of unknown function (DUF1905)/Bacteriocin-protection, YdeI or OmpD-Associated
MVHFTATIKQFAAKGEKTGWSYIVVPRDLAEKLSPGSKKSFRVKGSLDDFKFSGMALLPMGGGEFILALNGAVRKAIHKKKGAMLKVSLEADSKKPTVSKELLACLADAPAALERFRKLPPSHQLYYSKWVESAKTAPTKEKRIVLAVRAMELNMSYAEMLRSNAQL